MPDTVFGDAYSAVYDRLYAEKDYAAECRFLGEAFRRFASGPVRDVADFGCGTGNHARLLAAAGFIVTGVDLSPAMLQAARAKSDPATPARVRYLQGDVATVELGTTFDALVMMFAVLGYQTSNARLAATLANVRRHLRTGGLFVADFWYGPAVLATRPSDRVRTLPRPGGKLLRCARTVLDTRAHVAHVTFDLLEIEGERVVRETSETHDMRFLFPEELEFHLQVAGLEPLSLTAFADFDVPVSDATWNAVLVARSR